MGDTEGGGLLVGDAWQKGIGKQEANPKDPETDPTYIELRRLFLQSPQMQSEWRTTRQVAA